MPGSQQILSESVLESIPMTLEYGESFWKKMFEKSAITEPNMIGKLADIERKIDNLTKLVQDDILSRDPLLNGVPVNLIKGAVLL